MSWLSSLLGMDAQHNAGQAQKQSQQQLALQNQYGQQASGVFGNMNQQGQAGAHAYNQDYLGLLNRFGSLSGLGANAIGGNMRQPGQGNSGPTENPYQLDQNQQALLNQTTGNLARQHQQAASAFAEQMQAQGISDPRALQVGHEALDEHFAALKATTETQFYEQIKQDKLKALQELIGGLESYGKTGIAEEEAAGSGYLGLAAGAQASSAQQQQQAFQQQNLASSQQAGLAQLIAFGAGGGFGGGVNPVMTGIPFNSGENLFKTGAA